MTLGYATTLALIATFLTAFEMGAQRGPRRDPPTARDIEGQLSRVTLDSSRAIVVSDTKTKSHFVLMPARLDDAAGIRELEGGRVLGILRMDEPGVRSRLAPGSYVLFLTKVRENWRVFAFAQGRIAGELAEVKVEETAASDSLVAVSDSAGFIWGVPLPACYHGQPISLTLDAGDGEFNGTRHQITIATGSARQIRPRLVNECGTLMDPQRLRWRAVNEQVIRIGSGGTVISLADGTSQLIVLDPESGILVGAQVDVYGRAPREAGPTPVISHREPSTTRHIVRMAW